MPSFSWYPFWPTSVSPLVLFILNLVPHQSPCQNKLQSNYSKYRAPLSQEVHFFTIICITSISVTNMSCENSRPYSPIFNCHHRRLPPLRCEWGYGWPRDLQYIYSSRLRHITFRNCIPNYLLTFSCILYLCHFFLNYLVIILFAEFLKFSTFFISGYYTSCNPCLLSWDLFSQCSSVLKWIICCHTQRPESYRRLVPSAGGICHKDYLKWTVTACTVFIQQSYTIWLFSFRAFCLTARWRCVKRERIKFMFWPANRV
jgi:hypothetical protein